VPSPGRPLRGWPGLVVGEESARDLAALADLGGGGGQEGEEEERAQPVLAPDRGSLGLSRAFRIRSISCRTSGCGQEAIPFQDRGPAAIIVGVGTASSWRCDEFFEVQRLWPWRPPYSIPLSAHPEILQGFLLRLVGVSPNKRNAPQFLTPGGERRPGGSSPPPLADRVDVDLHPERFLAGAG